MTTALILFSVNAFADSYKKRIYSERAKHNALPFRCSKLGYYLPAIPICSESNAGRAFSGFLANALHGLVIRANLIIGRKSVKSKSTDYKRKSDD